MKKLFFTTALLLLCYCCGSVRAAENEPTTGTSTIDDKEISIYQGAALGSEKWTQTDIQSEGPGDKTVRNVTTPTLTAFLPDPATATGTAVIVCPGGGFRFLSWENEGTKVAEWFQKKGVAAFVLKYRLKQTAADPQEYQKEFGQFFLTLLRFKDRDLTSDAVKTLTEDLRISGTAGIADGRQAVRFVRQNARGWGIKKDRIGLMGFSAGAIITRNVACDYEALSRPDFAVHVYGPVLESIKVPSDAPPIFIVTTADDALSEASSVRLYDAWRSAGCKAELHIFEKGGHGFGMAHKGLPVDGWTERLGDWLAQHQLIHVQSK